MWIVISPSSACAAEAADSTSPSHCAWTALASSFTWRETRSPAKFWYRRMNRWAWLRRFCGRMSAPLTATRGVALLIASLRATRASRSPRQVDDVAKAMGATFGRTFVESLMRSARRSVSSRMLQGISNSDLAACTPTWKGWVTWWKRDCSRRVKRAVRCGVAGSLLWLRPQARDYRGVTQRRRNLSASLQNQLCALGRPDLARSARFHEWLMGWPEGLSGFACSATAWCRFRERMRSQLCWLVSQYDRGPRDEP